MTAGRTAGVMIGRVICRPHQNEKGDPRSYASRIARAIEQAVAQPVLPCSPALRAYFWRLFTSVLPHLGALPHNEVPAPIASCRVRRSTDMHLKRYRRITVLEARRAVRDELGPDALILSNRLVTAAADRAIVSEARQGASVGRAVAGEAEAIASRLAAWVMGGHDRPQGAPA